jgi:hypothetical protein
MWQCTVKWLVAEMQGASQPQHDPLDREGAMLLHHRGVSGHATQRQQGQPEQYATQKTRRRLSG